MYLFHLRTDGPDILPAQFVRQVDGDARQKDVGHSADDVQVTFQHQEQGQAPRHAEGDEGQVEKHRRQDQQHQPRRGHGQVRAAGEDAEAEHEDGKDRADAGGKIRQQQGAGKGDIEGRRGGTPQQAGPGPDEGLFVAHAQTAQVMGNLPAAAAAGTAGGCLQQDPLEGPGEMARAVPAAPAQQVPACAEGAQQRHQHQGQDRPGEGQAAVKAEGNRSPQGIGTPQQRAEEPGGGKGRQGQEPGDQAFRHILHDAAEAEAEGAEAEPAEAEAEAAEAKEGEAEAEGAEAESTEATEAETADAASEAEPAGESGSKVTEIQERGVLLVGATGDYRPMSYLDPETGTYEGFDVELAKDLAESLDVEIEFVPTTWPTLLQDTIDGKFDIAITGITITEERQEQALMSDGYLGNGKTVLCRAEDAEKYTSIDAINQPDVRVMENPGGLNEQFAEENLPNAQLTIHETNEEIPGLIAEGEADVMITEIMEAGYYAGLDDRLAAPLIDEPFTQGELGALIPNGAGDLLQYVNAFFAMEKNSGRLDELADTYIYMTAEGDAEAAA